MNPTVIITACANGFIVTLGYVEPHIYEPITKAMKKAMKEIRKGSDDLLESLQIQDDVKEDKLIRDNNSYVFASWEEVIKFLQSKFL